MSLNRAASNALLSNPLEGFCTLGAVSVAELAKTFANFAAVTGRTAAEMEASFRALSRAMQPPAPPEFEEYLIDGA